MAGMFDDLIPTGQTRQGGGMFDDLIPAPAPQAPAAAIEAPVDPLDPLRAATEAHDANTSMFARLANDLRTGMSNVRQGNQALGLDVASRFAGTRDQILNTPPGQAPVLGGLARVMREQSPDQAMQAQTNIADAIAASAQGVADEQALRATIPQRPVMEALDRAGDWRQVWEVFKTDPLGAAAGVTFQSAPQQIPSLVAAAGAGVLGGAPAATLATVLSQFMSSYGAEYGGTLIEELQGAGVDVNNPQVLAEAFQNPEIMGAARETARLRAGIVGGADALSGGLASRTLVPGQMVRGAVRRELVDKTLAQPAQGMILGAGGEAAAQLATKGEIEKPGQVFMEALGEGAMAPVEGVPAAVGAVRDRRAEQAPQAAPQPNLFDDLVPAPQAAPNAFADLVPAPAPVQPEPTAAPAPQPAPEPATAPVVQPEPETPAPAPVASPEPAQPRQQRVMTAAGRQIDTNYEIVDLAELQAASGDLQPRDRSRAASAEQISNIAANLDPERLMQGAEADRGAPIVGPDNIVESGNGRVAAIRQAAEQNPDRYAAYVQALQKAGYATDGKKQPVLVRRRTSALTPEDRKAFVYEANQSATMGLSATERAKADRDALSADMLKSYDPDGDVLSARNRPFIQGWVAKLPQAERNTVVNPDGSLSQEGARRLQGAMLARAYDDQNTVSRAMEATDDNAKSVTGALIDASAAWARLRSLIEAKQVDPSFDVTPKLMRAVGMLRTMREQGRTPQQVVAQQDAFDPLDPVTEGLFRSFFNKDKAGELTTAAGRAKIAEVLRRYVDEASNQTPGGDMFGARVTPEQIVKTITTPKTNDLFAVSQEQSAQPGQSSPGRVAAPANEPTGKPAVGQTGGQPGAAAPPATPERATRKAKPDGEVLSDKTFAALEQDEALGDNIVPRGGLSRTTTQVAFTPRTSIYQSAFRAAGLDPEKAALMPEGQQIAVLTRLMKDEFGFKDVRAAKGADKLETLDALLDAYQNVQFMLHALGLPKKALGLDGTLSLVFEKYRGKYLGAYYPGTRSVHMPGRANSFAHEWMHAFDHFLMDRIDPAKPGFASDKATKGKLDATQSGPRAMLDLMRALYKDQAAVQIARAKLVVEAQETRPDGKPTPAARKAQKELDKFDANKGGVLKGVEASNYAKTSEGFGDPGYWANPMEMLARAAEAFVASKVAAAGGGNEFIAKGDAAYLSNADRRLAETFPKDADRAAIFSSISNLFTWLRVSQAFGDKAPAMAPSTTEDIATPANLYKLSPSPSLTSFEFWSRELRMFKSQTFKGNVGAEGTDARNPWTRRMADSARAFVYAQRSVWNVLENRAPKDAAPFLKTLREAVATAPGTGRVQRETFEEAVTQVGRKRLSQIEMALKRHGFEDDLSPEQTDKLRALLVDPDEARATASSEPVVKLAVDLRRLMKDMLYYVRTLDGTVNDGTGLEVGFVENYLPRQTDDTAVFSDPAGFEAQATKVYDLVFGRTWPGDRFDTAALVEIMGELRPEARLDFRRDNRDEIRRIAKLARQIKKLEKERRASSDPDQIDERLAKLSDDLQDALDAIYDPARAAWTQDKAAAWRQAVQLGDPMDFGGRSPDANFTKKRALPPETDTLMKDYMVTDPVDLVAGYVQDAARRVEYVKRFGTPGGVSDVRQFAAKMATRKGTGWNPKVHDPDTYAGAMRIVRDFLPPSKADYQEIMLAEAVRRGLAPEDARTVRELVQITAGRNRDSTPTGISRAFSWLNTIGTLTLLPRAVWTSMVEPITVLAATRDVKAAGLALGTYVANVVRRGNARELAEIAMAFGINASPQHDEIMNTRFGQNYADSVSAQKLTAKFFQRNGLAAVTRYQRSNSAMVGAFHAIRSLSRTLVDPSSTPSERAIASADLREIGIEDQHHRQFAEWMSKQDRLPPVEQIVGQVQTERDSADTNNPDANYIRVLGVGLRRLVDHTIQDPKKADRPLGAVTSPVLRVTFGIMSFSYAMWNNVVLKNYRRTIRDAQLRIEQGGEPASKAWLRSMGGTLAAMTTFYASTFMGQLLFSILREAVFNSERWEEKEKKGELWDWLVGLAASRASFYGPFDPLVQAQTGLRYERDLTGLYAGPYMGYFLGAMQAMMGAFGERNAANTNTAEWNAAKGFYQATLSPMVAVLASSAPGGPAMGALYGAMMHGFTSNQAADKFANMAVGEKDTRKNTGNVGGF
jgi:hypothetical protein